MPHQRLMMAVTAISLAVAVACSKSDTAASDSAQKAATVSATVDTGMGSMPGMDTSPARDPDQEFVRMMVDHHQGLIVMSDSLMTRTPPADVKNEAKKMRAKQSSELQRMTAMLKSDYDETKMPMVVPDNARMIMEVASKTRAEAGKIYRQNVIVHHQAAIRMIDDFMPRLTKPAVREMATTMKRDQAREIDQLKAKLSGK